MVKFKAKPFKAGAHSYVITVPKQYIKDGLVNVAKEQLVELKEVQNGTEETTVAD